MIKVLIVVGLLSGVSTPQDSVGLETVNGKVFIIHKVDEKETLYGISRRYRTTVDAIIEHNAGAEKGLEIGQVLKVPYAGSLPPAASAEGTTHVVTAGETLYAISRKFDVSVDDLRQWNRLTSDALSVGQELVVKKNGRPTNVNEPSEAPLGRGQHRVESQETLFSISRKYNVGVDDLRSWNKLETNDLQIGQVLVVERPVVTADASRNANEPATVTTQTVATPQPVKTTPVVEENPVPEKPVQTVVQPHTIRISESIKNGSETIEAGLAELIEGTEGNRKYLALHRTAPIGSILKVRNEMNNREVFVRVMGKLPDTALTDKVLIRISRSAYDRLGAIDQRFRVEVTYYK